MTRTEQLARVFPRRTKATPIDSLAFTDPPGLFLPEISEVHVSVTFSWDLPRAETLAEQWRHVAPVTMGGPACGTRGEAFEPGMYLRPGYVITSRGCPNRCWFCSVWKREGGGVRELSITEGSNVLDDNLLACSDDHVRVVFAMLATQKERIHFTGGLEAARLRPWHVDALRALRPKQLFFAYDTPDDLEPLRAAGHALRAGGFTTTSKALRAYVLIGYPRDSLADAARRLQETIDAGFVPMAMLWRDYDQKSEPAHPWRQLQRAWARPAITGALC